MTNHRFHANSATPWLWATYLMVGWVAAFLIAFLIVTTTNSWGMRSEPTDLRLDLGLFLGLFGVFGVAATLAATRLVVGRWPRMGSSQLIGPAIGVALAISVELTLHQWAEVHLGQYDFDNMGATAILSFALVAVAIAWSALLVAPQRFMFAPTIALVGTSLTVLLVVLSNVAGLLDGVEPESWPLAILIGLSGLYAVAAVVIAVQRRRAERAERFG